MTTMMTNSQFGLEDMEVLLWDPSSPMADAIDFLSAHPDQGELQERGGASPEGDTSPVSPLSSSSLSSAPYSPPSFSPPPTPPPSLLDFVNKVGLESDMLPLPWMGHPGHLRQDSKEDMFSDLDWMAERVDLDKFDLESLMGTCSSTTDESPSSPEDLLASLDCPMEFDSLPISTLSTPVLSDLTSTSLPPTSPTPPPPPPPPVCSESITVADDVHEQDVPSPPLCVPEPLEELEIKSEPASPRPPPPPSVESPCSTAFTLDLGSEVDVSESEVKPAVAPVVAPVQRFVLSLSPTRIVLLLAPKEEVSIAAAVPTTSEVLNVSASPRPSRSRPYPEPPYKASPPSPKAKSPRGAVGGDERPAPKTFKVKKLKKMEQNKTAATRYRQKKKTEKEALLDEHTVLERKNMELKEKAESMAREIEYLKELMAEVTAARTKKGLSAAP